jgi:endonuclease/exonuclease/phosphatase family metal-dependent hydrolase
VTDVRLMTYNIHGLRDDVDAISEVIRACQPDVVCIQEAPRFLRWRSKRAAIARKAGLVVATADRPAGLMLMTSLRVDVTATHFALLPKSPRLHQRAVCSAELVVGGVSLTVASVHLSLSVDERGSHLTSLWAALPDPDAGPLVVAGDVNETPDGPVWAELSSRLVDAWATNGAGHGNTYSAVQPHKRIDGIFASRDIEVTSCRAVDDVAGITAASDHLPVLADLRL